jgi:hypothetical protein
MLRILQINARHEFLLQDAGFEVQLIMGSGEYHFMLVVDGSSPERFWVNVKVTVEAKDFESEVLLNRMQGKSLSNQSIIMEDTHNF